MIQKAITIQGKVQGVFFRRSTKELCKTLSILGFIKNLENDKVYIEVQGTQESIDKLLEWCKNGPDLAKVEKISIIDIKKQPFTTFTIL